MTAAVSRGVAVPGGTLAVERYAGEREPVLVIHGVSSHRKLWLWLSTADPSLTLIAPDLRGRGDSVDVAGESSIAQHATDLLAVLDDLDIESAHVVGMSMGGFVAASLAAASPERVKSLILVDGGLPMAPPPGLTPEAVPVVFRDRLARLDRKWSSVGEFAEFFVANTAPLLDPHDPLLVEYLHHDLRDGRVRLSADALVSDALDIFFGEPAMVPDGMPVRLVAAEWSVGRDTPPAYDEAALQQFQEQLPQLRVNRLSGTDHAATIMTTTGGEATAELIREALG